MHGLEDILYTCSIVVGVLGCVVQSISLAMINGKLILSSPLQFIADIIENFSIGAFLVYSLPFITDQMIGASGDELSSAVDWFFWCNGAAYLFSRCLLYLCTKAIAIPLSVCIYILHVNCIDLAGQILTRNATFSTMPHIVSSRFISYPCDYHGFEQLLDNSVFLL